VSWQLAAFAFLALGLLAGFAWFERTRPDARIVALVGTLAAFAALGRIAFAAVPNVKPTGDIVLIAGYSLGGAPGYVVGAVSALTSNFFFGQGPWTPWQMAGWGATGIAGALIARLTRGHIGRLPLASVCFVLGFGFTALQDAGDWVTYSDHSLAQLGFYVGKGIGFDLVYACGCFGFAILFGPALIRTLTRFRTRVQVTWLPRASGTTSAALLVTVIAVGSVGSRPSPASAAPAHGSPIAYLVKAQNPDGGFGSAPGEKSDTMDSAWATIGLFAGVADDPAGLAVFSRGEHYLATTVASEHGAGAIERTALAASLLPHRLTNFGGRNLTAALRRLVGPNGSVDDQTNLTAFGIMARLEAGLPTSQRTLSWLARQQNRDGGFDYSTRGGESDIDDTGAVLEALAGTNEWRTIRRAISFIRQHQNRDGGYGMEPGAPSNAQSTAFAVSGLAASSVLPFQMARHGLPSPQSYLRSLIQPDGAVDYSRGNSQTPVWVTAQAEIALHDNSL
jgi:energy-coupling factor transport system substrate-specific component